MVHRAPGEPWPPIPDLLARAGSELSGYPRPPQACLVNYYGPAARMGLHQDRDEEDLAAPVVSFSLGATCRFRIGGTLPDAPPPPFPLASGGRGPPVGLDAGGVPPPAPPPSPC